MEKLLVLLAILPLGCFFLANRNRVRFKWFITGITFGVVVAPVSLALIKFSHIVVIGKLIGAVGLVTNLIHGSVGYFMLMTIGIIDPGGTLSSSQLVLINLVNGVIWSAYYGVLGYNIDTGQTAIIPESTRAA